MLFVKGVSGNLKGRPKVPEDIKKLRNLSHKEISEIGAIVVRGNREALLAVKDDPNSTVLQSWIASVAYYGIKEGNAQSLNALLDRLVGKVKEQIDITIAPRLTVIKRANGEDIVLGSDQVQKLEDANEG